MSTRVRKTTQGIYFVDTMVMVKGKHIYLSGQILSKIAMSQSLGVGAYYHHERYDGKYTMKEQDVL